MILYLLNLFVFKIKVYDRSRITKLLICGTIIYIILHYVLFSSKIKNIKNIDFIKGCLYSSLIMDAIVFYNSMKNLCYDDKNDKYDKITNSQPTIEIHKQPDLDIIHAHQQANNNHMPIFRREHKPMYNPYEHQENQQNDDDKINQNNDPQYINQKNSNIKQEQHEQHEQQEQHEQNANINKTDFKQNERPDIGALRQQQDVSLGIGTLRQQQYDKQDNKIKITNEDNDTMPIYTSQ